MRAPSRRSHGHRRQVRHYAGRPVRDAWIEDNDGEIPAQELLDIVPDTGQGLFLCQ